MPDGTTQPPSFLDGAREIVARQQAAFDAVFAQAMGPDAWKLEKRYDREIGDWAVRYPKVETVEACAARLEAEAARSAAFEASPEGRFLRAAWTIYEATGDDRLLNARSRGLDTNHDFAARVLKDAEGPAAEAARAALADFVAALTARAA